MTHNGKLAGVGSTRGDSLVLAPPRRAWSAGTIQSRRPRERLTESLYLLLYCSSILCSMASLKVHSSPAAERIVAALRGVLPPTARVEILDESGADSLLRLNGRRLSVRWVPRSAER